MKNVSVEELERESIELRKKVITMIHKAKSGHPGGSLSAADFVTALYFREMNLDPKNPKWEDRDRFVLSKGHVCPVQYAALATLGFFDESVLGTLRQEGSILQGHPDMKKCPGIDISTGSLGQGLACGVGMGIAAKKDDKDYRVFVVVGDGECQEGRSGRQRRPHINMSWIIWWYLWTTITCSLTAPPMKLCLISIWVRNSGPLGLILTRLTDMI